MKKFFARVRVVLKAAPTYLVLVSATATIVTDEVAKVLPSGWQDNALQIGGVIVSVLGAAVAIVRRVTPVLDSQKGLLGPEVEVHTVHK